MDHDDEMLLPLGFRAAAVRAGIKSSGELDLAVLISDRPAAAAGTFTQNRVAAAPVHWDRAIVPRETARGVVINAGNANAATGELGLANTRATADAAAGVLGCRAEDVLIASTGVIGHQLPMDRLHDGLALALAEARPDVDSFRRASLAILTTDTRPKVVSKRWTVGGEEITLLGLAKGAAMIGPNMATMLGFLLSDAWVDAEDLRTILSQSVEVSFNCISVEGHASTNDTVLILANGASGSEPLRGEALAEFAAAVELTCMELARMIPGDGEGATHRITIDVEGAPDRAAARAIAQAVANSPLVKTAIAGADPNWGRIVSAAGYAGVDFAERDLSLWLDGVELYRSGTPLPFDDAALSAAIRANRETHIKLVLAGGSASIRFWTCDLTAEYVRLNSDYTT